MGKFGALAILLAVAAVIYLLNPGSPVQVAKEPQVIEASLPNTFIDEPAEEIQTKSSQAESIDSAVTHSDNEGHNANEKNEIPQYIKDSLEAKRIPASELVEEQHADGSSSINFKGQYQHVPVAIIGEDGKVKIIETRIEPLPDQ